MKLKLRFILPILALLLALAPLSRARAADTPLQAQWRAIIEKNDVAAARRKVKEPGFDPAMQMPAAVPDYTLLRQALDEEKTEIALLMLQAAPDAFYQNERYFPSLENSANLPVLKWLLNKPAFNPNTATVTYDEPLIIGCAQLGNVEALKLLLADPRVDPTVLSDEGSSILYYVAGFGDENSDLTRRLLADKRFDPGAPDKTGETPLYQAAEEGRPANIKLLLADARVNPNATNKKGETPLHFASDNHRPDAITALLADARTNPNAKNNKGETPLYRAAVVDARTSNGVAHGQLEVSLALLRDPRVQIGPREGAVLNILFDIFPFKDALRPLADKADDEKKLAEIKTLMTNRGSPVITKVPTTAPAAPAQPVAAAQPPTPDKVYAGDAMVNARIKLFEIIKARTGNKAEEFWQVKRDRSWLEYRYKAADAAALDGVARELERIPALISAENAADAGIAPMNVEVRRDATDVAALVRLERAQYATGARADFEAALAGFKDSNNVRTRDEIASALRFGTDEPRVKSASFMAAELRAYVGAGDVTGALKRYKQWSAVEPGGERRSETALLAMVEALDMVGDFSYSRALILRNAVAQIEKDSGKFVLENQRTNRNAMNLTNRHIDEALKVARSESMFALQRARLAGALMFKPEQMPADLAFIQSAPDLIAKQTKTAAPAGVLLAAATVKLENDAADKTGVDALLREALKSEAHSIPAGSVLGLSLLVKGDKNAESTLSRAIGADPILAFSANAQAVRYRIYSKSGRAELAEKDKQNAMQFEQVLALLSAPAN